MTGNSETPAIKKINEMLHTGIFFFCSVGFPSALSWLLWQIKEKLGSQNTQSISQRPRPVVANNLQKNQTS